MKATVHDANVLIDLLHADLLAVSLHLGFEFHVADVVATEIRNSDQRRALASAVENGTLQVDSGNDTELEEIIRLQISDGRISFGDAASLVLARRLNGILLTGDRPLRELAGRHHTETHGILWLLDELVHAALLPPSAAASALRTMLAHGARLPRAECDLRLRNWGA